MRRILSLWYTKEPVVYQRIDQNVTIIESVSLDRTITKYKIWGSKDQARSLSPDETSFILNQKAELPWLWIGADSLTGCVDMTSSLEKYLLPGNTITPEFLISTYPTHFKWKYLHPVTFKEVVFPDSGITIDAPRVEGLTEENQEAKSS